VPLHPTVRGNRAVGDRGETDTAGGNSTVELDQPVGDLAPRRRSFECRGLHEPVAQCQWAEPAGGERR
jgi:hypothetical protein